MSPAEVVGVRLGDAFEELVEGLFPFCFKLPDITGYHRRHNNPLNKLCSARTPRLYPTLNF